MARYQIILAYDGTHFAGYQRQAEDAPTRGGLPARTVQGEVEAALRRLGWTGRSILSAGRTDTGVHASGQVIAFDLDWRHSPEALLQALNAYLPADTAAQQASLAPEDFHPRFSARARRYRYQLFCQPQRDPLRERYAWRVWPAVEASRLEEGARLLIGTHDFAAFGTPPRPEGSTIRTVWQAGWQPAGQSAFEQQRGETPGLQFEIVANAFLYHMVRRLVHALVRVGQGHDLEELALGLTQSRSQTPGMAPPQGLNLVEVIYDVQALSDELRQQESQFPSLKPWLTENE